MSTTAVARESTSSTHDAGAVRMPSRLSSEPRTGIPFGRLVAVECRKLVDTRSGRWLLIGTAAITALLVGIIAFTGNPAHDKDFGSFFMATFLPQNFLLPILGIMAVTTEWSQRTGLVTFTLEPRRARVAGAKLVAVSAVGLGVVVLGAALAAFFTLFTQVVRGSNPDWSLPWQTAIGVVVAQLIALGMGFAFGALIQNTPGAIVTYLFLPIVWSALASVSWMHAAGRWADTSRTLQPLLEAKMTGLAWAHLAVSVAIWVVLPLTIGLWRMVRSEVKSS